MSGGAVTGPAAAPPAFVHVMAEVGDLERAVRFYEAVLGFRVVERHRYEGHRLAYLASDASALEIELVEPEAATPQPRPHHGWHMAFRVSDLAAEHSRIAGLGYRTEPITAYHANGRFMVDYFYVYDPDGHQIEILQAYGRYA